MLPLECPDEVTGAIARVCQRASGAPTIPVRAEPAESPRGVSSPLSTEVADAA
jgi:hypothetical protein